MLGLMTQQGVRSIHRKEERKKEGTGLARCSEAVYRIRAIVGGWHDILITRQLKKDFLHTLTLHQLETNTWFVSHVGSQFSFIGPTAISKNG